MIAKIKMFNDKKIIFDEKKHIYYLNKEPIISVSQLIAKHRSEEEKKKFASEEFQNFLKPFAEFGSKIHKITELLETKLLKESELQLNDKEAEAIKNWNNLLKKASFDKLEACELIIYSDLYHLIGTIDRLYTKNGKIILLDIKTGHTRDEHWKQQLIYAEILAEWGIFVDEIVLLSTKNKNKLHLWSELSFEKMMNLKQETIAILEAQKKEAWDERNRRSKKSY